MQNCPMCGAAELAHETRDVPYTYKGRTIVVPSVNGYHCARCSEVTLDRDAADRYGDLVEAFQRKVNSELIDLASAHG